MRILTIVAAIPFPPTDGGKARAYHLARAMSQHCHLDMLCLQEPSESSEGMDHLASVGIHPYSVRVHRRSIISALRLAKAALGGQCVSAALFQFPQVFAAVKRLSDQNSYDVVQAEQTYLAHFLDCARNGCRSGQAPLKALSLYDIESLRFPKLAKRTSLLTPRGLALSLDSKRIQGWEKEHTRRADVCIAVSKDDAEYLGEEYGIANVLVVPNGVDCAAFAPPEDNVRNPYELLFMGGLHYAPNLDAVNWLAAEIFPEIRKQIPQMTCTLVGPGAEKHQERLERAGLQVLGLVPDVRPYLHRATAMVVPLRAGGGTRVKILEAMAAGLPVISTHLGAEGLGLRHEEHVLYADQPEEFATAAKRLVSDPPLWSRLAENGMRLVQEKYDWSALGLRLLSHYELLLRERPSS